MPTLQPFGEISFENEIAKLGNKWDEYFFEHTNFVKKALETETYLIVGRRGSGKSSLCEYFNCQDIFPDSIYINFGHAESYNSELFDIIIKLNYSPELITQKTVELWNFIFWQLLFKKFQDYNPIIKDAIKIPTGDITPTKFIKELLRGVLDKFLIEKSESILDMVFQLFNDSSIENAKKSLLDILKNKKVFIVIDSREQYDVSNFHEMCITAALVQASSEFNVKYSDKGLNFKVCVADEVFPYLKEQYISNTLKYIRHPLYMYWQPKDLLRLICWRFFKYLKSTNHTSLDENEIDWESYKDIHKKIWIPYFGEDIVNNRGQKEKTFPYILRHTHLRPRQLIFICNNISSLAKEKGEFPRFSEETIKEGILGCEFDLADELINSYANVYPNAGDIIASLQGLPIEFVGSMLNKVSARSASKWTTRYSPNEFIKLITEIGIIGRKRGNENNSMIIKADFEFSMKDRLFINELDTCVIHPLFYSKLNINRNNPVNKYVYPFPNHDEFISLLHT